MKSKKSSRKKITIGWEEWCGLPELGISAIKFKTDTGARTSALHAYNIKKYEKDGERYVSFKINPLQRDKKTTLTCHAKLVEDKRKVKNSGGEIEKRCVIKTTVQLGTSSFPIELTLTNRNTMRFRMLLGRAAMKNRLIVDPSRAFCQGKKVFKAEKST